MQATVLSQLLQPSYLITSNSTDLHTRIDNFIRASLKKFSASSHLYLPELMNANVSWAQRIV